MKIASNLKGLTKIGVLLVVLHFLALLIAMVMNAEYDGNDFPALMFYVAYTRIFLFAGGAILLFQGVRWLSNRTRS
jgi:peptidoglycan/LPS O-acetylase OafA/YrhL